MTMTMTEVELIEKKNRLTFLYERQKQIEKDKHLTRHAKLRLDACKQEIRELQELFNVESA